MSMEEKKMESNPKSEERIALKDIIKEVVAVVRKFFKSCDKDCDEALKIPKEIKKSGNKVAILELCATLLAMGLSFCLTISNWAFEVELIGLGLAIFMLYRGQEVVKKFFDMFRQTSVTSNSSIVLEKITVVGGEIVGFVSKRVLKYDEKMGVFRVMNNEEVMNCVKRYLENVWEGSVVHKYQIMEILSGIIMLVVSVATNKVIPSLLFCILLVVFSIASFFSAAYLSLCNKRYYVKDNEAKDQLSTTVNDLLRVPEIVPDVDMNSRLEDLKTIINKSKENTLKYTKEQIASSMIGAILSVLAQFGIIIAYVANIEWAEINKATITEITANLVIVETLLFRISQIFRTLSNYSHLINGIEKDKDSIDEIIRVYYLEKENKINSKAIEDIVIVPFEVRYTETSSNDKAFTLCSNETIEIKEGSINILYGTSGSGKSTFMNMITQRIHLQKTVEIPSTSRFLFFDENLRFGSLDIFSELFCRQTKVNLEKMEYILKELNLWAEISRNCHDVWTWMKEKHFDNSLSNGQKQRLILAKMLYWMSDSIDVLVLDEATSGLDDSSDKDTTNTVEASDILSFIVRFVNLDRKRTVIISTHQNIDSFVEMMTAEGFNFNKYLFAKNAEGKNEVKKLS